MEFQIFTKKDRQEKTLPAILPNNESFNFELWANAVRQQMEVALYNKQKSKPRGNR
jgi:hypothetical protein